MSDALQKNLAENSVRSLNPTSTARYTHGILNIVPGIRHRGVWHFILITQGKFLVRCICVLVVATRFHKSGIIESQNVNVFVHRTLKIFEKIWEALTC